MKRLAMILAIAFSMGLAASSVNASTVNDDAKKEKKECCAKAGDKKEACAKAGEKKNCCAKAGDKKACSSKDKKACCSKGAGEKKAEVK